MYFGSNTFKRGTSISVGSESIVFHSNFNCLAFSYDICLILVPKFRFSGMYITGKSNKIK